MKRKYKKQLKLVLSMPTMGGKILRRNFIKIFDQDIDFQYLEARGLIEYSHKTQDSSGYKVWFVVLTKNGLTYFDKHWEERWHFIVRSFFVPILVSLITNFLVWFLVWLLK